MPEFVIYRVLGPIVLCLAIFETYNFGHALPPDTTPLRDHDLKRLPFDGQDFVALLNFVDIFDCTAWMLNPIESKVVRKFANILCADTPMVVFNTQFMHSVVRLFPDEYNEEAKRRILLMHEDIGLFFRSK